MIGISKLYCGQVEPSDALRYGRHSSQLPSHLLQFSEDKKPVVVWNMTRRCNLKCVHCYAQAVDPHGKDEISTEQGKAIISDLAAYGAPVMLFSGGEPLVRQICRNSPATPPKRMRGHLDQRHPDHQGKGPRTQGDQSVLCGHLAGRRRRNPRQVPRCAELLQEGA